MTTRFGFVAVLGRPNVGKSTLINAMVGSKVTIVSPKAQTTRNRILGIAVRGESQIVLIDTPGIFFTAKRRLEKSMVQAAWSALEDADQILLVIDAAHKSQVDAQEIMTRVQEHGKKVTLVINKIDLVNKEKLLHLAKDFEKADRVLMVSALTGSGMEDLLSTLETHLPEGVWHYPEDQLSDLPQRLLAAEVTREQVFLQLHEELPYSVMVETEEWEDFRNGDLRLSQAIYVQRESQRSIILGKGGQRIRKLGERARAEMTSVFERKVHLKLHVIVKENWMERPENYRLWGLDFSAS